MKRFQTTALGVCILVYVSLVFGSSPQSYLLKLADRIVMIDEQSRTCEIVFRCEPYSYEETETKLSSSGNFLAVKLLKSYSGSKKCSSGGNTESGLVVVNLETGVQIFLCNVQAYDWAPSKEMLVYFLSDDEREADTGDGFFSGQSIWLYYPQSGTKRIIGYNSESLQGVKWSVYDEQIYILDRSGVIMYDMKTESIAPTSYQDVYISADRKYCFRETVDDPASLYLTSDKKPIRLIPDSYSVFNAKNVYAFFIEWGIIDDKTVVYVDSNSLEYVDCATGRMYKVTPPSPDIDPINDLVGFRDGRPVWARITGAKAELFYYQPN